VALPGAGNARWRRADHSQSLWLIAPGVHAPYVMALRAVVLGNWRGSLLHGPAALHCAQKRSLQPRGEKPHRKLSQRPRQGVQRPVGEAEWQDDPMQGSTWRRGQVRLQFFHRDRKPQQQLAN
jgi:hypothetical protein